MIWYFNVTSLFQDLRTLAAYTLVLLLLATFVSHSWSAPKVWYNIIYLNIYYFNLNNYYNTICLLKKIFYIKKIFLYINIKNMYYKNIFFIIKKKVLHESANNVIYIYIFTILIVKF